jgi:hypothetical protein
LKCAANGQQCLGYGQLFRWTHAVASRGKMAGQTTFGNAGSDDHYEDSTQVVLGAPSLVFESNVPYSLVDPLFYGLGAQGQFYAHHCMSLTHHGNADASDLPVFHG